MFVKHWWSQICHKLDVVAFNVRWGFSTVAISAEIHSNHFAAMAVNNVDKNQKQFVDVGA